MKHKRHPGAQRGQHFEYFMRQILMPLIICSWSCHILLVQLNDVWELLTKGSAVGVNLKKKNKNNIFQNTDSPTIILGNICIYVLHHKKNILEKNERLINWLWKKQQLNYTVCNGLARKAEELFYFV